MSVEDLKRQLFSKHKQGSIEEAMCIVMKEFGYTLKEMTEMPLPTFYFIITFLNKEAEAKKKSFNKSNRGRK